MFIFLNKDTKNTLHIKNTRSHIIIIIITTIIIIIIIIIGLIYMQLFTPFQRLSNFKPRQSPL